MDDKKIADGLRLLTKAITDGSGILARAIEVYARISLIPTLIQAKCSNCKEITAHVSHIARNLSQVDIAMTTSERPRFSLEPLKTCLVCGLTSYKQLVQ